MIDRKCNEATTALGVMPEPRLLLTAALLIAAELAELKNGVAAPAPDEHGETRRLERIAGRIEAICAALEERKANAQIGVDGYCPGRALANLPEEIRHTRELSRIRFRF